MISTSVYSTYNEFTGTLHLDTLFEGRLPVKLLNATVVVDLKLLFGASYTDMYI
jgi:hypothetical protein